jgi:L-alanine-DL-glutamate epimerase-like enolase superfamily enzyme
MPNMVPPVYACGYSDDADAVGKDGRVSVPDSPGLGVQYDWGFIERNRVEYHVFTL